eukprot:CAMPEP_0185753828 /NCGR_PEP_ID=MMETSP1174-20130828/12531_1 /TAXON_ID=35687 /ORGANISM="Dictyocha speculum, Strain CCMP1381" /LENGTH=33 /DNA_ID= /DNA_START= /DNA_END= /DNA_ORIENTATION=
MSHHDAVFCSWRRRISQACSQAPGDLFRGTVWV